MTWLLNRLPRRIRKWLVLRAARKQLERAGVPDEQLETIMGGWKTWAGGILSIASGVSLIAAEAVNGTWDMTKISEGAALIAAGLAVIGVGHKIEKTVDAAGK